MAYEKPRSKYELLRKRRHFPQFSNTTTTQEMITGYPVGQWPANDHLRQKTHYPHRWNQPQAHRNDTWRAPHQHVDPETLAVRVQAPYGVKAHFPHAENAHYNQHLARTISSQELYFDRKRPVERVSRSRGGQFTVESELGPRYKVPEHARRNGVPSRYPGDKGYEDVERSDKYWAYGSVAAAPKFGQSGGGHNITLRPTAYEGTQGLPQTRTRPQVRLPTQTQANLEDVRAVQSLR